jgi:hypothetical protein
MPKILEDRRKAIARAHPDMPESSTWAIATSSLQKEGKMPRKKYQSGGAVDLKDADAQVQQQTRRAWQAQGRDPNYDWAGTQAARQRAGEEAAAKSQVMNYCKGGKVISSYGR